MHFRPMIFGAQWALLGPAAGASRPPGWSNILGARSMPLHDGAPWPLGPGEDPGLHAAGSQERGIGGTASGLCEA